jgi:hypothetical protein
MNVESLLLYAGVALGGWLLRHLGIGAGVNVPGVSTPASAAPAASHVSLMATLKADIEQIVKSAIEATLKKAIEDIKAAVPPPPVK